MPKIAIKKKAATTPFKYLGRGELGAPIHSEYLHISPEVKSALNKGQPVVALESTIITHGMQYPMNRDTALAVEEIIRKEGAVPATIGILGGVIQIGL